MRTLPAMNSIAKSIGRDLIIDTLHGNTLTYRRQVGLSVRLLCKQSTRWTAKLIQ